MRQPDPGTHRAPHHDPPARRAPLRVRLRTAGLLATAATGAALLVASTWPTLSATPVGAVVSDAGATARGDVSRSEQRAASGGVAAAGADQAAVALPAYRVAPRTAPLRRVPGLTLAGKPKAVVPGVVLEKLPPPPTAAELAAAAQEAAVAGTTAEGTTAPATTAAGAPYSFQHGTFNILGSQHTRGSSRYASGTTRAGNVADLIRSRGVDVIGLQEVQDDQLAVLRRRLGGYGNWPGQALGGNGQRLQLFWDAGQFEMVDAFSFDTVFDHQMRPIPVVKLRHRASGVQSWHMVIHNSPRDQEGARDQATGVEIKRINELRSSGLPVYVVGDMNEKEEWFCRVSSQTGLAAANGGSTSGGCKPPPRPLRIDWIMGGGGSTAQLGWSSYVRDTSPLVQRTSDHDFLYATATVTPQAVAD